MTRRGYTGHNDVYIRDVMMLTYLIDNPDVIIVNILYERLHCQHTECNDIDVLAVILWA
jgi:hypothetical protein